MKCEFIKYLAECWKLSTFIAALKPAIFSVTQKPSSSVSVRISDKVGKIPCRFEITHFVSDGPSDMLKSGKKGDLHANEINLNVHRWFQARAKSSFLERAWPIRRALLADSAMKRKHVSVT